MHPAVEIAEPQHRPARADLLLVMVFFVWALLEALLVNTGGSPAARVLASVGYSAPLLWRRQAPLATLGAIGSIAAARAFSTYVADQGAMPFPALLVGTFSVGLYVRRLPVSLLGAVFPVALLLALSRSPMWRHERQVQDYAILTFFVSAAWLSGYLIRRRAAQVNAAESAAGERARAAVTSERARIARASRASYTTSSRIRSRSLLCRPAQPRRSWSVTRRQHGITLLRYAG